ATRKRSRARRATPPRPPRPRPSSGTWARSAATIPVPAARGRNTSTATASQPEPGRRKDMAVHLSPPPPQDLLPVRGVKLGVAQAGIRKSGRSDLLVVALDPGARVAGVFTQNRFCAAPVQVAKEHLASGAPTRALVVNTGNANAGTGKQGLADARASCAAAARL